MVSSRWPQRLSSESHLPFPSTQDRRVPRSWPAAPIAKKTVPTCPSEHTCCSTSYSQPLPHQQSRVYAKAACISECIVTLTGAGRIIQSNQSSSRSRLPSRIVVVVSLGHSRRPSQRTCIHRGFLSSPRNLHPGVFVGFERRLAAGACRHHTWVGIPSGCAECW